MVPQAFQGYRLLQEYFALPQRFLFVDFSQLTRAVQRCSGQELELIVLFNSFEQSLESSIGAEQFVPFCTPAINLFPRRLDRIHLTDRVHEHHAIADRTRPMDFEIHSLKSVTGHGTGPDQPFLPFYAVRDPSRYGRDKAYYVLRREPRVLSSEQRRNGTRSNYVGSETFISLVDSQQAPYGHDLRQLGLTALCTNRDLPLFMSVGSGKTPARQPCPRQQGLAPDQPAVAELPVIERTGSGRSGIARTAPVIRRRQRRCPAIADRRPARALHPRRLADAGPDRIWPGSGNYPGV